jgi:hypothetical protein
VVISKGLISEMGFAEGDKFAVSKTKAGISLKKLYILVHMLGRSRLSLGLLFLFKDSFFLVFPIGHSKSTIRVSHLKILTDHTDKCF